MANERYLEILLTRSIPSVFGKDYSLVAQQLTLPSGRLDFVLEHINGSKHIIELKKDNAKPDAVDQVLRYLQDYQSLYKGHVCGWVVANGIPPETKEYAEFKKVKTLAVPTNTYSNIMSSVGLTESDLLGQRVQAGILIGGGVQNFRKNAVPFEMAIGELEDKVKIFVLSLREEDKFEFTCGKMQIVITYKGVKIGGINRSHRQNFVTSNIVLNSSDESILIDNGFTMIRKTQKSSSHIHVYWKNKIGATNEMRNVINYFSNSIEQKLFST